MLPTCLILGKISAHTPKLTIDLNKKLVAQTYKLAFLGIQGSCVLVLAISYKETAAFPKEEKKRKKNPNL